MDSMQPPSSLPLDGQIALVTGGSRGIGRAIALAFAQAGARVAICSRTGGPALDDTARDLASLPRRPPDPTRHLADIADITDPVQIARFAARIRAHLGEPTCIVNNAGTVLRGRLDEQDPADFRSVIDANFFGTWLVTREFLPAMRCARRGRIINIASISGRLGTPNLTAYCAAKHAVIGLTRALAEEVRPDGIQVNAICPGSVDTRMLTGSGFSPDMTPEDIARVALFLAASAPSALTGACLDVFG